MRIEHSLPEATENGRSATVTIGNFDGVHRGHQLLLDDIVNDARNADRESVVITFDPHPACVLRPDDCPTSITTLSEKRDRIAATGVDRLVVMPFTREVSQWSAEDFTSRLIQGVGMRHLVVGHDFALGHKRRGTVEFLTAFGAEHGFTVTTKDALIDEETPVSSSRIRAAVTAGDITTATRLLGHHYFIDAIVEHGEKVGRGLGFPTANLSMAAGKCLPQRGIYTTWARVAGAWRMAATSVGYRPTFNGDRLLVEAFLLDFDEDIYDHPIRLAFVERLRDEVKFDGVDALVAQMHKDVAQARERLTASGPPPDLD